MKFAMYCAMHCNVLEYTTINYNEVQCSAMKFAMYCVMQWNVLQCATMQCNEVCNEVCNALCNLMQCDAMQYNKGYTIDMTPQENRT